MTIDKYIIVSCPFVCGYPFKLNESLFPKRSQIFFTWRSIMSCVQDLSILSGYRSLSNSKFIWLIWRSRSLKTENNFSFSLNLGGMSSWRNLADSSARRFISISVLGKLRSWKVENNKKNNNVSHKPLNKSWSSKAYHSHSHLNPK